MRTRNHRLTIRLNDNELSLLQNKMAISHMNYSDIFRMFITDREIKVYPADDMKKLLSNMSKIGANINQIARVANSSQSVDASMLTEASFQVSKIWTFIKGLGVWR